MANLVFVYGTLKLGFPNSHLNGGVQLEGEWHSRSAYPLYLVGDRFSPWLIDEPGSGCLVTGEIFRVTDIQLSAMDRLERVSCTDGYHRQTIEVIEEQGELSHQAYAYFKTSDQLAQEAIRDGPLQAYERQHALRYRSRDPR